MFIKIMNKFDLILKEALLDKVEAIIRQKMKGVLDDKFIDKQVKLMKQDKKERYVI